jgi:hypothetical protein
MTIKEQIKKKYRTVKDFADVCEEKYGIKSKNVRTYVSSNKIPQHVKHILVLEGIDIAGKEEEDPDIAVKREYAEYMKNLSKQIKNWRAGL